MKKTVSILLVLLMLVGLVVPAGASGDLLSSHEQVSSGVIPITPNQNDWMFDSELLAGTRSGRPMEALRVQMPTNRFFDSDDEAGWLPGVTLSIVYAEPALFEEDASARMGVIVHATRIRVWETASAGLVRRESRSGQFSSIASFVLGFVPGMRGMAVSQIFGLVSLVPQPAQQVQAATYTSRRITNRDGEGQTSIAPNNWLLGLRAGRGETFRHMMGATLNPSNNLWTSRMHNERTAYRIETTRSWSATDTYFHNTTRSLLAGLLNRIEHSW